MNLSFNVFNHNISSVGLLFLFAHVDPDADVQGALPGSRCDCFGQTIFYSLWSNFSCGSTAYYFGLFCFFSNEDIYYNMPHSCAVKTCRNKTKTGSALSFHRLPVREPERLKLWLSALKVDVNTPIEELRNYIVCSEHFAPEDYSVHGHTGSDRTHRFLTPTAVPTVSCGALQQNITKVINS